MKMLNLAQGAAGIVAMAMILAACPNPTQSEKDEDPTVTERVLVSALAGDTVADVILELPVPESRAVVSVAGARLQLTDADGNPYVVALTGNYDTVSGAVSVTGEAIFIATTGAEPKQYIISVAGTYLSGRFSGTLVYTNKQAAGDTVSGAAAGSRTTVQSADEASVVLRFSYISDDLQSADDFDNRTGILVLDGTSFSWAGQKEGDYLERATGTCVQSGDDWELTCTSVAVDAGSGWEAQTASAYTAVLDLTSTIKVLKIKVNGVVQGVMTIVAMPGVVARYSGTWRSTPTSAAGTFTGFTLYDNGKLSFHWKGTYGVTLSPTTGTWTETTFNAPESRYWNGEEIDSVAITGTMTRTGNSISGTWNASSEDYGTYSGTKY